MEHLKAMKVMGDPIALLKVEAG